MAPGRVVAVDGPSAVGKTVAVRTVAAAVGGSVLPEAYRRLDPVPSLDFRNPVELVELERALLEEEARRFVEARARARAGATVIVDTGFLGPLTYTWGLVQRGDVPRSVLPPLLALARRLGARGRWGLPDVEIYLDAPAATCAARARADPAGHPAALARRHRAVGTRERRFYRERLGPVLGARLQWLRATAPARTVAAHVAEVVRLGPPVTTSLPPVRAVLALFPADGAASARGNR
ncbi:MAG: AAA family ATPase [Thermoplasmata archaeon]